MTTAIANPVLATVTRGGIVESHHRGAFAVVDQRGGLLASSGDIDRAILPRSAIKAFQCLAMIDSGAADSIGLSEEEIALACSSHSGEEQHVQVARSMLQKAGNEDAHLECGPHWPIAEAAHNDLVCHQQEARPIHNNCSGKHAGMLALARTLGADVEGYVKAEHPVQQAVAKTMGALCDCDLNDQPCGIDGCSVPTWAIPLRNLALGFARFTDPTREGARRIIAAVRAHPFLVAGTDRFDTRLMSAVPRAFIKTGAEGVYCACVPHAGIGVALKIDDGASRASQLAIAGVLSSLSVWTEEESLQLEKRSCRPLYNRRELVIGEAKGTMPDALVT
jgi:L-asparaginase II